ncbi:Dorsal root ganglia homeobox [Carabus blaptoides fortunei]
MYEVFWEGGGTKQDPEGDTHSSSGAPPSPVLLASVESEPLVQNSHTHRRRELCCIEAVSTALVAVTAATVLPSTGLARAAGGDNPPITTTIFGDAHKIAGHGARGMFCYHCPPSLHPGAAQPRLPQLDYPFTPTHPCK